MYFYFHDTKDRTLEVLDEAFVIQTLVKKTLKKRRVMKVLNFRYRRESSSVKLHESVYGFGTIGE